VTLTFITTDKNPAVVFPTSMPPDYGGSPDAAGNVHSAVLTGDGLSQSSNGPDYGNSNQATPNQDVKTAVNTADITVPPDITASPPITVIVKPSAVVINNQTFIDNPAQPTSIVVVDGNTFTIKPTEVDGVGATITRPPSGGGGAAASSPTPTKTTIGGLPVDIVGSSVVIDSTSFTIGPKPTTVVVKDQTITLGPGGIIFPSQTLAIPAAQQTTQVVYGAELVTAIGSDKVVIEGTTITYGPGITYEPGLSTTTKVIDGETILIGPSGIIVHGETYGGIRAASTDTQYEMVGGVTISQVGPTEVVIQGVTYTFGPLAPRGLQTKAQQAITTVIGGETITTVIDSEPITTVVGGETITTVIDSKTVTTVIDGKTITSVIDSETITTVVGGETITTVIDSETITTVVGGETITTVIDGKTVTTAIGGETITIGPEGVAVSTWTFASPYASTTTITPGNGAGNGASNGAAVALPSLPTATSTSKENGGPPSASRPSGWGFTAWISTSAGIIGAVLLHLG
jgi:hypothetical protein